MVVSSEKAVPLHRRGCSGGDSNLPLRCCRKRRLQLVLTATYCVAVPSLWEIKPGNGAWCDREIMLGNGYAGKGQWYRTSVAVQS